MCPLVPINEKKHKKYVHFHNKPLATYPSIANNDKINYISFVKNEGE